MKQAHNGNIYLWSDIHFFHKNILRFCPNRKFDNLLEMHLKFIKRFNSTVKPEDTVIFAGDIFLGGSKEDQRRTLSKLICKKKIIVLGNHDRSAGQMESLGFDFACHEMVLYIQGERVRISHYPYAPKEAKGLEKHDLRFLDRRPVDNGEFLLHGHTHSTEQVNGRMIHIGVDANPAPISINKIASIINAIRRKEEQLEEKIEIDKYLESTKHLKKEIKMRKKALLGLGMLAVLTSQLSPSFDTSKFDDIDPTPFDPTYADIDFAKTQKDKQKQGMDEYETFNLMHSNDGTFNKCVLNL